MIFSITISVLKVFFQLIEVWRAWLAIVDAMVVSKKNRVPAFSSTENQSSQHQELTDGWMDPCDPFYGTLRESATLHSFLLER
jgi:hypothetical protein